MSSMSTAVLNLVLQDLADLASIASDPFWVLEYCTFGSMDINLDILKLVLNLLKFTKFSTKFSMYIHYVEDLKIV